MTAARPFAPHGGGMFRHDATSDIDMAASAGQKNRISYYLLAALIAPGRRA